MVELFPFGSDLMCGLLKALPCKNRRFGGENWFPPLVHTYSKSTTSFIVPAQTLIGVKLLIKHNSGNSHCRTCLIKHNAGNTCCAVGKKSDHHDSPLNNVSLANLFDGYCAFSPCILCVFNVTYLTFLHHTFFLHTILDMGYRSNFLTFYP